MHVTEEYRIRKTASDRGIEVTLTALSLRRNMIKLFRYRPGRDISPIVTGRAIIGDTYVIKHAAGKVGICR